MVKSWKNSGWDYRFYSDKDARLFLQTHFPPEVLEAFDALIPGAFKADLFRYCVLFICGGVYADIDMLLETNLDSAIDSDVGFMTSIDWVSNIFQINPLFAIVFRLLIYYTSIYDIFSLAILVKVVCGMVS